jgi:hypothetical protein
VKKPLTAAAAAKEKAKKHAAAEKAARTRAKDKAEHKPVHHVKVKVSHKPVVKRRKWSPDGDVALCSARAVAESLRIALGRPVSDRDVLGLYWSVASDADAGISILDALRAAQATISREVFAEQLLKRDRLRVAPESRFDFDQALALVERSSVIVEGQRDPVPDLRDVQLRLGHVLIVGLDLPWGEPHAVTYDPRDGTWWSWGQPYKPADFPGAVIEEAWAVWPGENPVLVLPR